MSETQGIEWVPLVHSVLSWIKYSGPGFHQQPRVGSLTFEVVSGPSYVSLSLRLLFSYEAVFCVQEAT